VTGWIEVACALCGSLDRDERFRDGPWTVMSCGRCELVYVTPRLDDDELIGRVYDDTYWRSPAARERGYTDYGADHELHRRTFERRLRALGTQLPRGGRALDVGCATGAFLELLAARGFEVLGVEPSAAVHAEASRRLGPERVLHTTLEQAGLEGQRFDLISMWDVLEHLPRPLRTLRLARGLLAPGGRLVVETQDVRSLAARALGRRWQHYKHAEHLVHFDAATLARALEHAGLEAVTRTRRAAGKYVRPAFLAERALRLAPWLARALAPLERLGGTLYLNPHDEWIVVARERAA
jgi:2-polyprenyl-3-methyl-5-hydroxy-6-metoxy-1,4-benzoquinol methylase